MPWFTATRPAPPSNTSPAPVRFDATTHADLAVAYAEMGLISDAILESIIAVGSDESCAKTVGRLILDHLSAEGWASFAAGVLRG